MVFNTIKHGLEIRSKILLGRGKGGICTTLHMPERNIHKALVLHMGGCSHLNMIKVKKYIALQTAIIKLDFET